MTRQSTLQRTRSLKGPRWVGSLLALALVVAACGDDGEDTNAAAASPEVVEACGQDVADTKAESSMDRIDLDTTDFTQAEKDAIALYREIVADLTAANPTTCSGLTEVAPVVGAADVEAFEAISFQLDDPRLRYDAFLYPSRQAATDADARTAVEAAVTAAAPAAQVQTRAIGSLFVVRTDDGGESAQDVAAFYDTMLAGEE